MAGMIATFLAKITNSFTPDSAYTYRRAAASTKGGSMRGFRPQPVYGNVIESYERQVIAERAVDLVTSDPIAAGIVDSFATTVIGAGLVPIPGIKPGQVSLDKDETRRIQREERAAYETWYPQADAARRLSFGAIQFQAMRSFIEYGEFFVLAHMIDDPARAYSLALQIINPMRVKTPYDLASRPDIRDGVELGAHGEPIAYWIKKSSASAGGISGFVPDTSANFIRVPARTAHRMNVIHGFIPGEPEQVRGTSSLAPAMKLFLDLGQYLNAELASNTATAAFALFIEVAAGQNPWEVAGSMAAFNNTAAGSSTAGAEAGNERIQELEPGAVIYGQPGQKPSPIAASRPGATFEPFVKMIKKSISMSLNIPYPVLFADVEGVNFAGFRSAMLSAWRVYEHYRAFMTETLCQPVYTMLLEEAYLRGTLSVPDFYGNAAALTSCQWRGSPKGDIEPVKGAQADILLIQNNLKTRAEAVAERGGDVDATFDQLEEEQEMMEERGLIEGPVKGEDRGTTEDPVEPENPDDQDEEGDE